jgi:hypothetical protein
LAIHRIRPAGLPTLLKTPGKHADGAGLYLQVPKSGTGASWTYQYSLRGRVRWMSIGPAVTFSLAEARDAHHEARRLRDRGIDPLEARGGARAIHKSATAAVGETFADCVADLPRRQGAELARRPSSLSDSIDSKSTSH